MTRVLKYTELAQFQRPPDDDILNQMERENIRDRVPLVGPSVGRLLFIVARMIRARKVLELGTANGYSTIWLARAIGPGGAVHGTEFDPEAARIATENLVRAGVDDIASVRVGDAIDYIAKLDEPYDMIFLDIEKEDYTRVLEDCVRLLRPGGVLFADNVAFKSAGDFNSRLMEHPEMESVILSGQFLVHSPDEDSVSISVKRR